MPTFSSSSHDLLLTIRGLLPSLNEQEQKVGQYVLDHPTEVIHLAVSDLADARPPVMRPFFAFPDASVRMATATSRFGWPESWPRARQFTYTFVRDGDSVAEAVQKVIAGDVKALEDTLRVLDLDAPRHRLMPCWLPGELTSMVPVGAPSLHWSSSRSSSAWGCARYPTPTPRCR